MDCDGKVGEKLTTFALSHDLMDWVFFFNLNFEVLDKNASFFVFNVMKQPTEIIKLFFTTLQTYLCILYQ